MKALKHLPCTVSLPGYGNSEKRQFIYSRTIFFPALIGVALFFSLLLPGKGFAQLNGTYTLDTTKAASKTNYKNLNSFFSDLNASTRTDGGTANGQGITGPVVLKIANGIYNFGATPSNLKSFSLTAVTGSSAVNTITITSASGDSSKVTFSNFLTIFSGTDHVIVSKIGFTLTSAPFTTSVVLAKTTNTTFTHNLFKLVGENVGILKYDTDTSDVVNINHNNFQGSGIGIFLNETKNIYISDNIISNASVASGLKNGHFLFFSGFGDKYINIKNNVFLRNVDTAVTISSSQFAYVSNNKIQANYGIGIADNLGADTIVNNILLTHKYGIRCETYDVSTSAILNNNIYTDTVGSAGYGACIWVDNKWGPFGSILNNNIQNGFYRAGIYFTSSNINGTLDYNNYYSADSFGYYGAKYKTFAAFQQATGLETHGLNLNPQFDFNNSLKTGNKALSGKGYGISAIKSDIAGNLRKTNAPTIGAYEIHNGTDSSLSCKGSCIYLTAPVTGRKYNWSTGDTTRSITYCPKKNITLSVKTWIGATTADTTTNTFKQYVAVTNCVWPGDANNDGKADINDILPIGIAYGDTGAKRPGASLTWSAQPGNDWSLAFKSGINLKNADANGDGKVDSTDVTAIALNFSKTHTKAVNAATGNPNDPPLGVKFSKDSVQAGDSVSAIISLGSNAIKANNVYGFTIDISYQAYKLSPKKIVTDFAKSWLGTIHKNMISLVVNDTINKVLHIGLTRIDHANASGAGEVAVLSIYMPDNVAGKREVKEVFNLKITDYKAINTSQDSVSLNPVSDSVKVYQYKAGIETAHPGLNEMTVYPNPAQSTIHIKTGNATITGITITDMMGKTWCKYQTETALETTVPIATLPSGLYILNCTTKSGTLQSRFIKN